MRNINEGKTEKRYLEEEMKDSYLSYAMSVIVGRALPDIRDGMKPVHRRILYTMHGLHLRHSQSYKKSARIVGEALGKYHPHGDSAVYDSLVRMAQKFSLRYPLVDGQGNFGSQDGDPPAAMRYTESRLEKIADYVLQDIEKDTVDMVPNFDNSLTEPLVLPTVIPNLLINGASGIAVGMATNIPPHNLGEVSNAIIYFLDNPHCSIKDLNKKIKGPDFPTGGIICGRGEILKSYEQGRGKITLRAKAVIEQGRKKEYIVITELPYQVNKSKLLESMANLVNNKKIEDITDIRDESDKEGLRITLEVKKGAEPRVVLNQLYKHTTLEITFGIIYLALVNNKPRVLNLKQLIQSHVHHRKEVIVRRSQYELNKAQRRAHILEGYKKAVKNLDKIVEIIKKSKSPKEAKEKLIKKFKFSDIQAQAILEMQLQRLTALEREKIDKEYLELLKKIEYLQSILSQEKKQEGIIKEELAELKEKFSGRRRTEIAAEKEEIEIEDLIQEEEVVITISHRGYIKRMPLSSYRRQGRGGRGVTAMGMRDDDFVEHMFVCSSKDTLLVFTTAGKVYGLKTYEVPGGSRVSRGRSIMNVLNLSRDEKIARTLAVKGFEKGKYILMATEKGLVKRCTLEAFANLRKTGIIAINLDKKDKLIGTVLLEKGAGDIVLATALGKAIRFNVEQIRPTGRASQGVKGIKLSKDDKVLAMGVVTLNMKKGKYTLFTITRNGFAKSTLLDKYRQQSRAGQGVISIKLSSKSGEVVSALLAAPEEEVMAITKKGILIRCQVDSIRTSGRSTQGVKFIKLGKDDVVSSVERIEQSGN